MNEELAYLKEIIDLQTEMLQVKDNRIKELETLYNNK